jgi:hypothetical protein
MQVSELFETNVALKKSGNKIVQKYRCTSGPRKGRVMSSPAACNAPYRAKAAAKLKATKAAKGGSIKIKTRLTKKYNPTSKVVAKVNRRRKMG